MTLISQSMGNIIGGVSQQTPSLRRGNQCEAQENCRNDPIEGMGKRFNSELIASITGLPNPQDYHFEFVTRDEIEEYIFAVKHGEVKVFDQKTGFEYTTLAPSWAVDYLANRGDKSPQRSYQMLNTIDTTFILNKTVPVKYIKSTDTQTEPPTTTNRLITIDIARHKYPWRDSRRVTKRGDDNTQWYEFIINGTTYRYEEAEHPVSLVASQVADWIKTEYPALSDVSFFGSRVTIQAPPNETVSVSGKWYRRQVRTARAAVNNFDRTYSGNVTVVETKLQTIPTPSPQTPDAIWHIRQADYNVKYTVVLDDINSFEIETPSSTIGEARAGLDTKGMVALMAEEINGNAAYVAVAYGSTLHITRADGGDFTITATDDLSDRGAFAIKGQTEAFEDLPPNAPIGFRVEIVGTVELDVDPYHVEYKETLDDGTKVKGFWNETRKFGIDYQLDGKTMPLALNRKQGEAFESVDNPRGIYFELEEANWAERLVGDDITAPMPSFCSKLDDNGHIVSPRHILSMAFHRNRLAFISDDNIIFSEAGSFLNFFPTTVITLLDGDVIDITIPLNGIESVEWTLEAEESLFLFAPKRQYRLYGGEVFNTASIVIDPMSSYEMDMDVKPFTEGAFMYFWMRDETASQLMEYVISDDTERGLATQVTAHIPNYITGEVVRTVTSTTERLMVTVVRELGNLTNTLYVHNFLWQGREKLQNAWQKWTFHGDIADVNIQRDTLYLLVHYPDDTVRMEKITLSNDPLKIELGHSVFLDSREEVDNEFVLPENDQRTLVSHGGRYFVGYLYDQKYTFSRFYPRTGDDKTLSSGRLQLRYLYLNYSDTTTFDVIVDRQGRDTKTFHFEGRVVGSLSNILGKVPVSEGQQQVRIQSKAQNATVSIINNTQFDTVIHSVDWEGTYVSRARRI